MPEPGNTGTLIGIVSSKASLRFNGAVCLLPGPVGPEGNLRHLPVIGLFRTDQLGTSGPSAMQERHARVLGSHLVEHVPDPGMIVAFGPARDAMRRPAGKSTWVSALCLALRSSRLSTSAAVSAR